MSIINKQESIPPVNPAGARALSWSRVLRSPYTLLITVYVMSRVIYFLLGVRFDARGLPTYLQFIDTELLQHNLLQSLFYLHWQPPGYNLFLGIVLKLFPHTYVAAFHVIHIGFGTVITCCLFYLTRNFGVRTGVALAATAVFIVSPGIVLFENFIMWEYQLMFFLLISSVLLFWFFRYRSPASAIGFLSCLFWLVLLRNQYHYIYFIAFFLLLLYFAKHNRRVVLITGSVLLALIMSLFLKNYLLFGKFESSTWLELGLGPLLLHQMSPEERDRLLAKGRLTSMGVQLYPDKHAYGIPVSAFRPYITMPAKTSIPVLDEEFKSSGTVNYNHLAYLEAQKIYAKDIRNILRYCPRAYLRSVVIAWYAYFLPAGDFPFFNMNLPRIHRLERFSDILLCGQFKYSADRKVLRRMYSGSSKYSLVLHTGVFLLIGMPLLFLFGAGYLYRGIRRHTLQLPQAAVLVFLLFNIFYTTATANFLSSYENNRYRFPVDGFYIILFALALELILRKIKGEGAAPRS